MSTTADMTAGTATRAPADTALSAATRRVEIEGATLVDNGDPA